MTPADLVYWAAAVAASLLVVAVPLYVVVFLLAVALRWPGKGGRG